VTTGGLGTVSKNDVHTTFSSELHHAHSEHPHPTCWTLSWGDGLAAQERNVPDSLVAKAKVSEDSARAVALKRVPGDLQSITLVSRRGRLSWGVRNQTHRPDGDHEGHREREQWSRRLRGAVGI